MKNKLLIGFLIATVIVCGTVLCVRVNHGENNKIDKEPDNTVKEAVNTINYLLTNDEEMLQTLIGTWKITERIVYPRAYSQEAMEDCDRRYLGRTIDLQTTYFDGEDFRIHKPYYNFIVTNSLYDFYLSPFGNFGGSEELHNACKSDITTEWYVLEILQNRTQEPDNSIYTQRNQYNGYQLDTGSEDELKYDLDECDIYRLLVVDKDTILFDGGPLYQLEKVNK